MARKSSTIQPDCCWICNLPKVVNKYDAGLIINHMRGMPDTWAQIGST